MLDISLYEYCPLQIRYETTNYIDLKILSFFSTNHFFFHSSIPLCKKSDCFQKDLKCTMYFAIVILKRLSADFSLFVFGKPNGGSCCVVICIEPFNTALYCMHNKHSNVNNGILRNILQRLSHRQHLRRILTHAVSYLEFIHDVESHPAVKSGIMEIIIKLYSILCWWDQLGIPLNSENFQITNINVPLNRQTRYNVTFIVLNNITNFLRYLLSNNFK